MLGIGLAPPRLNRSRESSIFLSTASFTHGRGLTDAWIRGEQQADLHHVVQERTTVCGPPTSSGWKSLKMMPQTW
jgi:hypothetical protein